MRLPKLKPCPFCGARPKLRIGLSEFKDGEIHCPCGCTSGNHPNADAAIEAWNNRPETDHLIAEAVADERERCAKIADAYADENIRMAGDSVLFDPVLSSKPGQKLTKGDFEKSATLILDGSIHSSMFHAAQNIAAAIRVQS